MYRKVLFILVTLIFGIWMTIWCSPGYAEPKPKNISIKVLSELSFGLIYVGGYPVTIDPSNSQIGVFPSEILVRGAKNMEYQVQLPGQIYITSGTDVLTVHSLTTNLPGNRGMFDARGESRFYVGGTVEGVSRELSSGMYLGKDQITVTYVY